LLFCCQIEFTMFDNYQNRGVFMDLNIFKIGIRIIRIIEFIDPEIGV
jgi:hypothetical protein